MPKRDPDEIPDRLPEAGPGNDWTARRERDELAMKADVIERLSDALSDDG